MNPTPTTITRRLSALTLLTLATTVPAWAQLFADYRFNGDLDSTGVSAPSLTDLGANGFSTAIMDGLPKSVFDFATGTGLSLDVSTLPDKDSYTFVSLFQFDQAPGGYQRILQTKNFTTDAGLYWRSDTALQFYAQTPGPTGAHQLGRFEQVVLVNNHGSLSGYVDGALQFSTISDASVSAANLMQFFRDESVENTSGQVARLRIFSTALTPSEVAGLDRLAAVPEPDAYAFMAGVALLAFAGWRHHAVRA